MSICASSILTVSRATPTTMMTDVPPIPKAFTPGVPARVPFRMTDIAHTFRAGHRIMVQVQSTWFPLAERNPQQFVDVWNCRASDFVPCKVSVLHQRSNASSVTVWRLGES